MSRDGSRPVFLNLMKIKLPIAGMLSILHRVSGILLFIATPFLIYLLQLSLAGPEQFLQARALLHSPVILIAIALLLWSISHHLLSGIRYLLLDIDIGLEHPNYIYSAQVVMIAAPIVALGLLWGML